MTRHLSVESSALWLAAIVSLLIIATGFPAPYMVAVALEPIAADLAAPRWVPSVATSLAYIGCGFGGIAMGIAADRWGAMPVPPGRTVVAAG